MSYKALYRKYRPQNFNEVAGQSVIIRILKNSIVVDKISHAYLFYGPRGTGKTSIAKIFAKTVNCDNSVDGIACGKCLKCIESNEYDSVDIIEIDAASNNGVDEIRELKSKINLVPSSMKYKVYIIDEVHMLSTGAFNALLKTLEEPPSHVIFILATTELNKVPKTIISRCQLMEFKKIADVDMFDKIKNIATAEKINIDDSAIREIVKYSDGGMRDALGLLEKVSFYTNDLITVEIVRNVCGNASINDIGELLRYINNKDISSIVDKIDELYVSGIDLINVVNDLIFLLNGQLIDNKTNNCSIILKLIETINLMKKSFNPKIVLTASILEIISNDASKNISREIISDVKNVAKEQKVEEKTNICKINSTRLEERQKLNNFDMMSFKNIRVNNVFAGADKAILKNIKDRWKMLSKYVFDSNYGSIASSLMDSEVVVCSDIYMVIIFKYDSFVDRVNLNFVEYEKFISELCGKKFKIVSLTVDEWSIRKKEYISKLKNNENYLLIDDLFEENIVDSNVNFEDDDELVSITENLFGKENVILN